MVVMARSVKTILLVADPQQLAQPSQADQRRDSGLSLLGYLMKGPHVVPPDRALLTTPNGKCPKGTPAARRKSASRGLGTGSGGRQVGAGTCKAEVQQQSHLVRRERDQMLLVLVDDFHGILEQRISP